MCQHVYTLAVGTKDWQKIIDIIDDADTLLGIDFREHLSKIEATIQQRAQ